MNQAPIIPMLKNASCPFKVQTITKLKEEHYTLNEFTHSHNYFEMFWVIKGQGKLYVDLQEFDIGNNMIFCLKPNQTHQFQMEELFEGFVYTFTDSFFNTGEHEFDWACQASLSQLFSECQVVVIQSDMEADMKEITFKMIKEFENMYSFRMQLLKRYFRIFLIYLSRQFEETFQSAGQTREIELVKSFMELIDKSFKEKKMVAYYATRLFVTPNYLNLIIKKNTGYSAGHHIRQRVVLEAKRLARYSDAGMKEIAYSLGFSDNAHFSRFFKTVAGKNFSDFKKEVQTISSVELLDRA